MILVIIKLMEFVKDALSKQFMTLKFKNVSVYKVLNYSKINASQFVQKIKSEFQELAFVHLDIIKLMENAVNVVQIANILLYIVDVFVMKDLFKL